MNKIIVFFALVTYTSAARLDHLQYDAQQQQQQQQSGQLSNDAGYPAREQQNRDYSGGYPQQGYNDQGSSIVQNNYNNGGGDKQPNQNQQQFDGQFQQRSPLADVPIVRLENDNAGDGNYRYAYETGNGIIAQEQGTAQTGWNNAQGSYQFTSPEGETFEISYTADENGYRPQGAHLPTPPPIPDAILKSLEVIRQAEAEGRLEGQYQPEGDDGQYHEGHNHGGDEHNSGNQNYQQQPQQQQQQQQQQQNHHQVSGPQQPLVPPNDNGYRY